MATAKFMIIASLGLLVAGGARAQSAAPPQRCEGTLCDLYYSAKGDSADATAKPTSAPTVAGVPAGATPLMAPSTGSLLTSNPLTRLFGGGSDSAGTRLTAPPSEPASASNSYMHMSSGGVLGHSDRCSGTLCDTYYGSSPAEPATASEQQQTAAATPSAPAEQAIAYRHIQHESETRPTCNSPANDPWRCFRK